MVQKYRSIESYCELLLDNPSRINQLMEEIANGKRSGIYTMDQLNQLLAFARQFQLDEVVASVTFMIGWFHLDDGKYEVALEYCLESYQIYDYLKNKERIACTCNSLMCIYFSLGMYDESFEWGLKALTMAKKIDHKGFLFQFAGNMTMNYLDLGKYKEAREMFDSIDLEGVEVNEVNQICMLETQSALALVENQLQDAKSLVDEAVKWAEKVGYNVLIIECRRLKAVIYNELGLRDECEKNFQIAIKECLNHGLEVQLFKTYLEWGKVYFKEGCYQQAESYLLKAYTNVLIDPISFTKTCTYLIELYKKTSNFQLALYYYEIKYEREKRLQMFSSDVWEKRINQELATQQAEVYRQLYDELQDISKVGQLFTAKLSYSKLLQMVYQEVSKLVSFDVLAFTQLNSEEDGLDYVIYMESGQEANFGSLSLDDENSLGVYCIKNKKNLLIHDLFNEYESYHLEKDKIILLQKGIQSLICCPLMIQDEVKGYITVQSYAKNTYSQRELTRLSVLTPYIAIALENANLYKKADYLARYDSLSGVYNRVEIIKKGQKMIRNLDLMPLSVIMLDIDHFKSINDSCGHQLGDKVIRLIGELLSTKNSRVVKVGRYGGEEFIFFLQGYKEQQAAVFAEQVRLEIMGLNLSNVEGLKYPLSASFGVYEFEHEMVSIAEGIHFADQAMYASKSNGRNRVTTYRQFCDALAIV